MNIQQHIENLYESTSDNIIGVSLGYKIINNIQSNQICICFKVKKKLPLSELDEKEIVPAQLTINDTPYLTDVIQGSSLKLVSPCLLTSLNSHTSLTRPIIGGVSITNVDDLSFYLGTLGALVRDNEDNSIVGLTNLHVIVADGFIASEKTSPYNTANKTVTQPALGDVASLEDIPYISIGKVKRFYPITSVGTNYIDAALVHIDSSSLINSSSCGVLGLSSQLPFATTSEIDSLISSNPKIKLFKSGRTTGALGGDTCDIFVRALNYTGAAGYNKINEMNTTSITLSDLIEFSYEDLRTGVCIAGDSGSILVGKIGGVNKIVGLVFANDVYGSTADALGYACRIDKVAELLNVSSWNGSNIVISDGNWEYIQEEGSEDQISIIRDDKKYWQIGTIE
jgi:hypothetical protein